MLLSRSRFAICLVAVFFSLSLLRVSAQTMFGRISVSVVDPSGAAVSGAKVVVTNSDTQSARTQTTDERGFFVADNLAIGPYVIVVDHPGFKRFQQAGNFVAADARIT